MVSIVVFELNYISAIFSLKMGDLVHYGIFSLGLISSKKLIKAHKVHNFFRQTFLVPRIKFPIPPSGTKKKKKTFTKNSNSFICILKQFPFLFLPFSRFSEFFLLQIHFMFVKNLTRKIEKGNFLEGS